MAIANAVVTGGTAALEAAKKYGPQAVKKAQEYLNRSGARDAIANLAKGSDGEQAAVITALVKGGLSIDKLSGALKELTPEEATKWAGLIQSMRSQEAQAGDAHVVGRTSTGDKGLDTVVRSRQIDRLCAQLNVSSDTLGELLTFFKSGTHNDIEEYQRNYAVLGLRAR